MFKSLFRHALTAGAAVLVGSLVKHGEHLATAAQGAAGVGAAVVLRFVIEKATKLMTAE